jgi:phosphoinositide-3-kinase regulatory subunit 4
MVYHPSGDADRENKDARVTEAMDVFSAGCVIAELFREGAPLFTLSQLFKYREGELNTDGLLSSVEDVGVRVSHTWYKVLVCCL